MKAYEAILFEPDYIAGLLLQAGVDSGMGMVKAPNFLE